MIGKLIFLFGLVVITVIGLCVGLYYYGEGNLCVEMGGFYSAPFLGEGQCVGLENFTQLNDLDCICTPKNRSTVFKLR